MVGRVPRVPVFAPVRTRTFAMQIHRIATAVVNQRRTYAGIVVRVVSGVLGRFRGNRQQRVEVGHRADHHLVVNNAVGQQRLVVHEVHRRGGHRGRRGRVVDRRRLEPGGRWPGTQHEAHHRYGEVKREQDELPVEPEKRTGTWSNT